MRLDDILCDKRFYEDPGVYLIEIEAIFEVIDPQNLRSTSTAALPLSGCLAIEGISFDLKEFGIFYNARPRYRWPPFARTSS